MIGRFALVGGFVMFGLAACSKDQTSPAAPSNSQSASLDQRTEENDDHAGGFQRLVAITGPGHGRLRATRVPHPTTPGNFAVHVEARLRSAKPNATYLVQRSAEAFAPPGAPAGFNLSTTTDRSCQRALALAPWTTLAPVPAAFVTWPTTLTTDQNGDGQTDFVFPQSFPLPEFDVMFRVLEAGAAPQSALLTGCTILPL
jgi:hypothetical protein